MKCYAAFLKGFPVGFIAVQRVKMKGHYNRVSRLVVLPDYQGVGIGRKLLTLVAEHCRRENHLPFYLITSNPQLIRGAMPGWILKRKGLAGNLNKRGDFAKNMSGAYTGGSCDRLTVSLEFLGILDKSVQKPGGYKNG